MRFPLVPWSPLFYFVFAPHATAAHIEQHNVAPADKVLPRFEHEAIPVVHRRQNVPALAQLAEPASITASPNNGVLAYVTPSPSASPIPVTSQSQAVDSFQPLVTFCAMPPLALISGSWVNTATTGPYLNASLAKPTGTSSCDTSYIPTRTTVCATTLTGLASKITITACEQNVTFSSQFGYTLETPAASFNVSNSSITATPTIRDLTTYYIASWQDLVATPGVAPQDVDIKICSTYANRSTICEVEYQEWRVAIVTITATSTWSVDLTATYPGPGEIIVHTAHWNVTDTITTFSLTSTFGIETSMETETTITGPRTTSSLQPAQTRTLTVVYNTGAASRTGSGTTTTTALTTETTYEGTSTATITPVSTMTS